MIFNRNLALLRLNLYRTEQSYSMPNQNKEHVTHSIK